jgi:hypothetical protein
MASAGCSCHELASTRPTQTSRTVRCFRPTQEYEEALGKLVFSSVDPTLDIVRDMDFYDER